MRVQEHHAEPSTNFGKRRIISKFPLNGSVIQRGDVKVNIVLHKHSIQHADESFKEAELPCKWQHEFRIRDGVVWIPHDHMCRNHCVHGPDPYHRTVEPVTEGEHGEVKNFHHHQVKVDAFVQQ